MLDKKDFQYYLMCNSEFSISKGSARTYLENVETFFRKYLDFTQENVDDYYLKLKNSKSPNYTNLVLHSLKHYNNFLKYNIQIPKDIKRIRVEIKEVVTKEYLFDDIFDAIDYGEVPDVYQKKAILAFMFYTGLRMNDLCNLQRKNFVFTENYGHVTVFIQKNQLNKKVLFPKQAIEHIVHYFDTTQEFDNAFNLSPTTIRNLFHRLNALIPEKHFHPHMMRSSAINHLYHVCDWKIEEIAEMIGIKAETIRNNYLNISMTDIETKYAQKMRNK